MNGNQTLKRWVIGGLLLAGWTAAIVPTEATIVPLQSATATGTQSGFNPAKTIDGVSNDNLGWAISIPAGTDWTVNQTLVAETVSDLGLAQGTQLTFTLTHAFTGYPQENLGKFRLAYTTDDRSTFADGLANGGDVTASPAGWTQLAPMTATSLNGATLTINGDNTILAGGVNPNTDVYTIVARTAALGITGFRLETFEDASFPTQPSVNSIGGPGRAVPDGNFVLSEFTVDAQAVPEPSTVLLLGVGGRLVWRRVRGNKRQ